LTHSQQNIVSKEVMSVRLVKLYPIGRIVENTSCSVCAFCRENIHGKCSSVTPSVYDVPVVVTKQTVDEESVELVFHQHCHKRYLSNKKKEPVVAKAKKAAPIDSLSDPESDAESDPESDGGY
jgi:hypothetical protein